MTPNFEWSEYKKAKIRYEKNKNFKLNLQKISDHDFNSDHLKNEENKIRIKVSLKILLPHRKLLGYQIKLKIVKRNCRQK